MTIIDRIKDFFLPPPPGAVPRRLPSPDKLVLLCRPQGEPEAHLFRGILEDNGIRSMVKNRDPVGVDGGGWGAPWKYELWVLRRDLRLSREILGIEQTGEPT